MGRSLLRSSYIAPAASQQRVRRKGTPGRPSREGQSTRLVYRGQRGLGSKLIRWVLLQGESGTMFSDAESAARSSTASRPWQPDDRSHFCRHLPLRRKYREGCEALIGGVTLGPEFGDHGFLPA